MRELRRRAELLVLPLMMGAVAREMRRPDTRVSGTQRMCQECVRLRARSAGLVVQQGEVGVREIDGWRGACFRTVHSEEHLFESKGGELGPTVSLRCASPALGRPATEQMFVSADPITSCLLPLIQPSLSAFCEHRSEA